MEKHLTKQLMDYCVKGIQQIVFDGQNYIIGKVAIGWIDSESRIGERLEIEAREPFDPARPLAEAIDVIRQSALRICQAGAEVLEQQRHQELLKFVDARHRRPEPPATEP